MASTTVIILKVMSQHLVTENLRRVFEDSYTHRSDTSEFAKDFAKASLLDLGEESPESFGRRGLIRRAYDAVDWEDPSAVDRLLGAWAKHVERLEHRLDHEERRKLQTELASSGLVYEKGQIHPGSASYQDFEPTEIESRWPLDHFRLFLSHVAARKAEATALKEELAYFNIAAFVAHEDIEPSRQWQSTIETALGEMHALAALLTSGFHESPWTDQEVGYGLGRGILAVGLRYELDPYGFMAQDQALNARGKDSKTLARDLAMLLVKNEHTRARMGDTLAARLARSYGYKQSQDIANLLRIVAPLTAEAKVIIEQGFYANHEVNAATNVREILSVLIDKDLRDEAA